MKKRVVIINDDLGTMALGFSKAGYDVSAICVTQADKNSIRVLEDNWGEVVRVVNYDDFNYQELAADLDVDFVAGKIAFGFSVAGKQREPINENGIALQAVCLLKETRPKFFLFQCNKYSNDNSADRWLLDNIIQLGYTIEYQHIDTRLITGLPVKEKSYFLFGSLEHNHLKFEFLKSVDTLNYSLDFLCEKKIVEDEWYYHVNPRHLQDVERYSDNAVLCWNVNHYKEVEFVNWNPRMIPLVAQGDMIRKITHREIARLKGIPDEYYLHVQDKMRLYQKLMYAPNVQLVQQVVSAICIEINGEYFQKREVSKGEQFENIIISFFKRKGITNINNDCQFQTDEGIYCFDFRIYRNNYGIEDKLIALCEKCYKRECQDDRNDILVIGNIVGREVKKTIEDKYKIIIWDVENLLWVFDEFPQIKSDFVSLLSFSVSDIVPKKPERYIFEQHSQASSTIDLQERLRKLPVGEEPSKYQDLTFEKLFVYYASKGITLNKRTFKKNMGLLTEAGKYNLLAQLLSDNSHIPIRFAIFNGIDKASTMYSVREFGNTCLLLSLDKVLEYGDVLNVPQADERDRKVERKEVSLFDADVFREAIVNAFVHNLWISGNAPMITVFSDRIEILSRGTIPPGQTMEGFFAGESVPVNQKLSDIFLQLHISERTGRGVPKITEAYGRETYEFRENSIVVSIPFTRVSTEGNLDERTLDRTPDGTLDKTPDRTSEENTIGYYESNNQSAKILQFCETPKGIYEIVEMLGYKDKKPARKYIKPLVEQGRLAMTIPDKPNSKYQKYVTVK